MLISHISDLFTFPLSLFCEQVDGEYPISCFSNVLTPEDLPALGAYEQQILERIEVGKQAGNVHWIEVNQKNLNERVRPAIALLKQGNVMAKTDKQEREYTDEEWEQRHHHHQEATHG